MWGCGRRVTAECACPRKIRLSLTAFQDGGPIVCAKCNAAFLPEDVDRDTYPHPTFGPTCSHGDDQADTTPADDPEDPMVFYDPTGAKYGIPTYPFKFAPDGYATRRQLHAKNLRPGGQSVAAQLMWRKGKRVAYLYRIDLALPKRTATAAQLAALDKANRAKRTCPDCGHLQPYIIPRRTGACLDCDASGGAA
ncbi:RRQRL motif-containing zinc-binding protein [Jidongwangia harbinensis]|uniref:RRQRL motif-containing zinc-binding protein n=1 Tax=Jidongwangia harbinensis TaxID=2878561 RepID=UPI0027DFF058|nr:RRQRL motif-containing zinc-binding protein [Jidongwangia harbinensis]